MPFKKGERHPNQGGLRLNAGRPSKETIFRRELEREAFIREAFRDGAEMGRHYRKQALVDNAILKDYRAALVGREEDGEQQQPRPVYFIQFNTAAANGAVQLPAEGLPNSILVSNGNGHQERGEGVASEIGKRQDRLEFHTFAHVSRKRG
jgi:hypothetical protein